MTDKNTLDIRYLKTFLVGPPGVGKTTTLNRLLKLIINICTAGDRAKVLTVYRALYRDVSTTTNVEHSLCGMYYVTYIHYKYRHGF